MVGNGKPRVGVLALQGDFEAHERALAKAGAHPVQVRTAEELRTVDALVIPGGESSTMLKLLEIEGLFEPLREFGAAKPVFGTCAGAILVAKEVANPVQASLGLMDIAVERNAYGRQLDSRIVQLEPDLEAVFIRAPVIRRIGPGVKVLASYAGDPVLVQEGPHMVATFHPELSADAKIHRQFVATLRRD
jgi:pyridoxal 5'-phosphate synthase pdxT subunit